MEADPFQGSTTSSREHWLKASSRSDRGTISFKLSEYVIAELEEIRNTIPEKPWRTASEMYRQLIVWGVEKGEELGYPSSSMRRALIGEVYFAEYDRWKAFNEGLIERYKACVDEARTVQQYEQAKDLGERLIVACTDDVIRDELVQQRSRLA